jgi:hypothetical protein
MISANFRALVCLTPFLLAIGGCATVDSVIREIPQKPPEGNFSGEWETKDWDHARLRQDRNEITGWIGDYSVQGLVTGKDVYLFLIYRGKAHITMKLTPTNPTTLDGESFYGLATPKDMSWDSGVSRQAIVWRKVKDAPPKN